MSYRIWLIAALLAGFSMFAALPAHATVFLDFRDDAGPGGEIVISGGDISGSGIPINQLSVVGTSSFDGLYNVDGSVVCTTDSADTSCGSLDFNTAAGSNFITITGGIPDLGIANDTVLLSGTFDGFTPGCPATPSPCRRG